MEHLTVSTAAKAVHDLLLSSSSDESSGDDDDVSDSDMTENVAVAYCCSTEKNKESRLST